MSDIGIEKSGHVALVEIRRPPNNFFDIPLIKEIAAAFESFDDDTHIRALVLAAQGKAFCAGANFGDGSTLDTQGRRPNEPSRSEEHTSELQSLTNLVCRLLLEKKKLHI